MAPEPLEKLIQLTPEGESVSSDDLLSLLDVPISFRERPIPLAPELRTTWRLAQFLYLLRSCCRQGRSSLQRLHVINWGARTPRNRVTLVQALDGRVQPHLLLIRVEPSLNRVIEFAIGEGLVTVPAGSRVQITARGLEAVRQVLTVEGCMETERSFVSAVGLRVTEGWVESNLTYGGLL